MKRRDLILTGSALATAGLAAGAAHAQSVPAQARSSPNIFEFGARGDGTTDDSAAFKQALQVAAKEMRKVVVPAFTYGIHHTITFTSTAHTSRQWGLDCQGAVLLSKVTGGDVMSLTSHHIVRYFGISGGLTIRGSGRDKNGLRIFAPGPGGKHFYNFSLADLSIEGVGEDGLRLEGNVFECQVLNSYFQDCGNNGATFAHSQAGICSSVNVIGCYFNQNGRFGLLATNFDDKHGGATDIRVIGGYCRENKLYGFYYNNGTAQGASVQQVGFENNCKSKSAGDPTGAHIFAQTRMQVRDCAGYNEFGGATYFLRGYFSALTTLDGCSQTSGGAVKATGKSRLVQVNGPATGHVIMRECVGGFDVASGSSAGWQAINCTGPSPVGNLPVNATKSST